MLEYKNFRNIFEYNIQILFYIAVNKFGLSSSVLRPSSLKTEASDCKYWLYSVLNLCVIVSSVG